MTSLQHKLCSVNQACNLLVIVMYDTEECYGLLKYDLKPYDNRSHGQYDIMEIVYDFSMTRAARALKIACDNRRQKSYHVSRPL